MLNGLSLLNAADIWAGLANPLEHSQQPQSLYSSHACADLLR